MDVESKVRTHGAAIARARVMRANGEVEIHYSLETRPALWNIKGWLWVARRLVAMKREDEEWLKSQSS